MIQPTDIIYGYRPLYIDGKLLYCSSGSNVYVTEDCGRSFSFLYSFHPHGKYRYLANIHHIIDRIFRQSVYRFLVTRSGRHVFTCRGGVYVRDNASVCADMVYAIDRGSRPTSLAYKPEGIVVWGEYFANSARGCVSIYGSFNEGQNWEPVYTFQPGEIRHVHGITYDKWEDAFFIATGDYGGEARLIRASSDFSSVTTLLSGGGQNRFYSMCATKKYLMLTTDSPNGDNYIVKYSKVDNTAERISRVQNSSFYSCIVGDYYICSINAEPLELGQPVEYASRNDLRRVHIWATSLTTGLSRNILTVEKDRWSSLNDAPFLPSALLQCSRFFLPDGANGTESLFCYGIGVKGLDNCLAVYSMSDVERLFFV